MATYLLGLCLGLAADAVRSDLEGCRLTREGTLLGPRAAPYVFRSP